MKKEFAANNVQLIDMTYDPILNTPKDLTKRILLPELSATYCFALLKNKVKEANFDPKKFLPSMCFENNQMVMPFHLIALLESLNLKLSGNEFQKLWSRLDHRNVGGIKTYVFLRLLNYNPNKIDEFSQQMDLLRTRSCINQDQMRRHRPGASSNRPKPTQQRQRQKPIEASLKSESISFFDNKKIVENQNLTEKSENPGDTMKSNDMTQSPFGSSVVNECRKIMTAASSRNLETSMSEVKIKQMVNTLKNTHKFGFSDDLVIFLNNRVG